MAHFEPCMIRECLSGDLYQEENNDLTNFQEPYSTGFSIRCSMALVLRRIIPHDP